MRTRQTKIGQLGLLELRLANKWPATSQRQHVRNRKILHLHNKEMMKINSIQLDEHE